ncbi:nose resistant to fluoxetine protein 6 [Caerostris darwini]|uniref:Nose resistant to fluoxetine protein 6 n=1 Tax=Caerostris darwini TaxID=1538125 RepID=A0AAV4TML5_9ARAC|nr:nose resistant to fluoxetine protein 6 [Caerostris darwini]
MKLILFIFAVGCITIKAQIIPGLQEDSENLTVAEKWLNMESTLKSATNAAIKMALPYVIKASWEMKLSSQCMLDSMVLVSGLRNIKPWALKFIDSSAKSIDGLMVGTMSSLGVYEECLGIKVINERGREKGKLLFTGQYCTIELRPPLPPKAKFYGTEEIIPELKNISERGTVIGEAAKFASMFYLMPIKLGICVPSGCTLEDINQVTQLLTKSLSINAKASRCEIKEEIPLNSTNYFVIYFLSFIGCVMFIGSLFDIHCYYSGTVFNNVVIRTFLLFSLITNFKRFKNTKVSSGRNLTCLHGIRFLTISWIILGHTYYFANPQTVRKKSTKALNFGKDFAFQAVINANLSVDTFFCIGGLLVSYLTIKIVKLGGHPFNVILYIIHRIWRIYPLYLVVLLFTCLIYPIGYGPLWYDTISKFVEPCHKYWWRNLLFINNLYSSEENTCLLHTWYIAADFQLYLASLIVILPILRWPRFGLSMCGFFIISSSFLTAIVSYITQQKPIMLYSHPDPGEKEYYWLYIYFQAYAHTGPYCIGFLAGYLLATTPDLKFSRKTLVVGWVAAFICSFSALYGIYEWNKGPDEPNYWIGLLYSSVNRSIWTLGVAWMIVCCAAGQGGIVNHILSWDAFIPLSRLTYGAYLIHPLVQMSVYGNIRTLMPPDHFVAVWIFFGHLCTSFGIAFIMSMAVEAPFLQIEKLIFRREELNIGNAEDPAWTKNNKNLSGTLKAEKNGDIAVIVQGYLDKPMGTSGANISSEKSIMNTKYE